MNILNKKIFLSITILILFAILTSYIKNETRVIERKIEKLNKIVGRHSNQIYEAQIDFSYLSSPKHLSNVISELNFDKYYPKNYSEIYLSFEDFKDTNSKTAGTNQQYEKK